MKRSNYSRLLTVAVLCLLSVCGATAQGSVHWQTAINDSLLLHLNVSYTSQPRQLSVSAAYIVRRGQLRRTPVEPRKVKARFSGTATPAFSLSLEFTHHGIRYQVHGRYTENDESQLRCVPLRLSKETIREGEYM